MLLIESNFFSKSCIAGDLQTPDYEKGQIVCTTPFRWLLLILNEPAVFVCENQPSDRILPSGQFMTLDHMLI